MKVIFDKKTGALIGAHMVGAEVTELIQGYVVAMNLETTEEELIHTIFPHPTLSEMMKEAVLDAYGRALTGLCVARDQAGRTPTRVRATFFDRSHGTLHVLARADRKITRLNSSHCLVSRMPSSA